MTDYNNLTDLFDDIADVIRSKTSSSAEIFAKDFPTKIGEIPTNFIFEANATISNTQRSFEGCVYKGDGSSN